MKKRLAAILLIVIGLLAAACGQAAPSMLGYRSSEPEVGMAPPAEGFGEAEAPVAADASKSEYASNLPAAERVVIQTGSLTLVVADPARRVAEIRRMAENMGGFVVSSYVYKTTYGSQGLTADQASVTIRVPAERLQEALEQIKQGAVEVRSENVSGEDVTQQYTDLQSRLRNLEAAEAQLLDIMEGAVKTEDVLAVYNQLVQVRGEIESVRGQIQYFSESASFSAISVELIPDEAAQPIEPGVWNPQGTVKVAVEALLRALQNIADGAIWIALYVLPVALIVLGLPILVIWLIVRAIGRGRARRAKPEA
ncbi:MAG TPA: DUF4349 domain-containing protein [Anaerolineales bacterium]|nr:DUF4349 domain-containing protein [Anaerolineales bacterium]